MAAGEVALARVEVANSSPTVWPDPRSADPRGVGWLAVRLSSRWWTADGPTSSYLLRADLSAPLPPGGSATLRLPVRAPASPGDYRLQVDLVEEGVAWFEDRGAERLVIPVRVRPGVYERLGMASPK
jgi:hypothetical protein